MTELTNQKRTVTGARLRVLLVLVLSVSVSACVNRNLQENFPAEGLTVSADLNATSFQYKRDAVEFFRPDTSLESRLTALRAEARLIPSMMCFSQLSILWRHDEIFDHEFLNAQHYVSNIVFECSPETQFDDAAERSRAIFDSASELLSDRHDFIMEVNGRSDVFLYVGSQGGILTEFKDFEPGVVFTSE